MHTFTTQKLYNILISFAFLLGLCTACTPISQSQTANEITTRSGLRIIDPWSRQVQRNDGIKKEHYETIFSMAWWNSCDHSNCLATFLVSSVCCTSFAWNIVQLTTVTTQPLQAGDPTRGEQLFRQTLLGARPEPGCITCHSLSSDVILIGPSLAGVATRSVTTIQQNGYTGTATVAQDYLRESILVPNAYIVDGFLPDLMKQTYAKELSAQQIEDLVAYLATLEAKP